jgi:hypothetical protein
MKREKKAQLEFFQDWDPKEIEVNLDEVKESKTLVNAYVHYIASEAKL